MGRQRHLGRWVALASATLIAIAGCSTSVAGTPLRGAAPGNPVAPTSAAPGPVAPTSTGPTSASTPGTITGSVLSPDEKDPKLTTGGTRVAVYNSVTGALAGGPTESDGSGAYRFSVPAGATYLVCADPTSARLVPACTEPRQVLSGQATTLGITLPQVSPSGRCDGKAFEDVTDTSLLCADITWLVATKASAGVDETHFDPAGTVTWGQLAVLLYRLEHSGQDAPDCTAAPFDDVPTTSRACGAIGWMADQGLATGDEKSFQPDAVVTRAQLAIVLYRLGQFGADTPKCDASPFDDVPADSPACGSIAWLVHHGISAGYRSGGFRPELPVIRGQLAAFLHRMFSTERIDGRVDDAAGTGLSGVTVIATGIGGTKQAYSAVSWDGQYAMPIVAPGTYRVCFVAAAAEDAPPPGFAFECYDDVAGAGAPTAVTVQQGQPTIVDAVLAPPKA